MANVWISGHGNSIHFPWNSHSLKPWIGHRKLMGFMPCEFDGKTMEFMWSKFFGCHGKLMEISLCQKIMKTSYFTGKPWIMHNFSMTVLTVQEIDKQKTHLKLMKMSRKPHDIILVMQ